MKLWASWFCMDGGDEQAFWRTLDISAYLNQEVKDVEEDVVLFANQFLNCTVILTGDGKGMQAMGGAGSKFWLCKDPNGIVEQMGTESTSRWGASLRIVTLTGGRGTTNMQHAQSPTALQSALRPPFRPSPLVPPEMEEHFSVFLHPNGVSAWALQEEAQKLFSGLVLGEAKYVPPPHAPVHVHERPGPRAFGTGGSQGLRH